MRSEVPRPHSLSTRRSRLFVGLNSGSGTHSASPSAPSQTVPKIGTSRSAFAPATIANLGPGFDFIGAALEGQGNVVTAKLVEGRNVEVVEDSCDVSKDYVRCPQSVARTHIAHATAPFPRRPNSDPDEPARPAKPVLKPTSSLRLLLQSVACKPMDVVTEQAARMTLQALGLADVGLEIRIRKFIPLKSGLGGTAAAVAATVWAVNLLFGETLSKEQCVVLASEAALSGYSDYSKTGRPRLLQDARVISAARVPAAVTGGFVLLRGFKPITAVPVPFGAHRRFTSALVTLFFPMASNAPAFALQCSSNPNTAKAPPSLFLTALLLRAASLIPPPRQAPSSRARRSAACGSASSLRISRSPQPTTPTSQPPCRCRRAGAGLRPSYSLCPSLRTQTLPLRHIRAAWLGAERGAAWLLTRYVISHRDTQTQTHVENCSAGASMVAAVQAGDLKALGTHPPSPCPLPPSNPLAPPRRSSRQPPCAFSAGRRRPHPPTRRVRPGVAIGSDQIAEVVRGPLLPGFYAVKKAAVAAGAYGCTLSGSGPTLVAITPDKAVGMEICKAMVKARAERREKLKICRFVSSLPLL